MRVLGIESSCDETAVAIYDSTQGLMAHALHSQIELHAEYGGVVPELASRDHIRKIVPLLTACFADAGCSREHIDGIAYTAGPGLMGSLLVGASMGQTLAYAWDIPSIAVHHMEGHLLAPLLEDQQPDFPFVALLVSGGHTLLVNVNAIGDYELLGESLDDAVGEAFDKTAKLLGLPYPGGPELAALATQGDPERFTFPRPMTTQPGYDFSFSGLKTFVVNTARKLDVVDQQTKADIARAFEDAVVDTLAIKCKRALKALNINQLVVAGGVGANKQLRARLQTLCESLGGQAFYPRPEFCTDNGAMIAYAGSRRLQHNTPKSTTIECHARWPLSDLEPIK